MDYTPWVSMPLGVAPLSAQDTTRMPMVGVMRVNTAANNEPFATILREELAA